MDQFFLRDKPLNALDGAAFHYSTYRSLTRFLGMDGNLQVAFDVDTNFITAWNEMFVNNDFLNPSSGAVDPRHMFGTSNFDVFRWPSLENGTQRSALGTFITNLVMPGVALVRARGSPEDAYLLMVIAVLLWRGAELLSLRHHCIQLSLRVSDTLRFDACNVLTAFVSADVKL